MRQRMLGGRPWVAGAALFWLALTGLGQAAPQPLDLGAVCNMGFRDELADDGKGGWTDQGGNDFRYMPLGALTFCGVPFTILDPAKNQGKSCLVLRGNGRQQLAMSATVPVARRAGALVFLHTLAWGDEKPVAQYVVRYADGKTLELPIRQGQEILSWWGTAESPAVKLAVVSKNLATRQIGLHAWQWTNPRPDVEIVSLELRSTASQGVPIIVAVTALDQPVTLKSEYAPPTLPKGAWSWLEAEDFKTFNVPPTEVDKDTKKAVYKGWSDARFSGGKLFYFRAPEGATAGQMSANDPANGFLRDNAIRATYEFTADQAGKYTLWSRLGPATVWSPFRWRVDQGEWGNCAAPKTPFHDLWEVGFWATLGWLNLGERELTAGPHTLVVEMPKMEVREEDETGVPDLEAAPDDAQTGDGAKGTKGKSKEKKSPWGSIMVDCYVVTRLPFHPCGTLKPGEQFNTVPWHDGAARNSNLDFTSRPIAAAGERETFDMDGLWEMARDQEPLPIPADTDEARFRGPITEPPRVAELAWMGVMVPHVADRVELAMLWRRWYRKIVSLPRDLHGKRVALCFNEANYTASVFVNGKLCGTHVGGYVPFSIDITDGLKADGEENEILIGIKGLGFYRQDYVMEAPWDFGIAFMRKMLVPGHTGWSWDCLKALPGSVWLETRGGQATGHDLFAQAKWEPRQLTASLEVQGHAAAFTGKVRFSVLEPADRKPVLVLGEKAFSVEPGKTALVEVTGAADILIPWWPGQARLYRLRAEILDAAGTLVDAPEDTFGFREIRLQDKWFLINGKRYNFRNCLSGEKETLDAALAQWREYNCNFLRLPMAFNKFFGPKRGQHAALDYMDAHGIPVRYNSQINGMVIDVANSDPRFWAYCTAYLKEFVKGYRNHPSVMVWVAENELDLISNMGNLPEPKQQQWAMMAAAKALDPSRPMMGDGAGDLLGQDELCSWHYPEVGPIVDPNNMAALRDQAAKGVTAIYPGNAFSLATVAGPCAKRPWDRTRPLWIGETYFYSGPITWQAWVGGDEALASRFAADAASARFVSMLVRGYRWQDVAGFDMFVDANRIPGSEVKNALAPVAVFSRDYAKNQYAGGEFTRRVKIFNDTLDPAPIHLAWRLQLDGKTLDSGDSDHSIREGFSEEKTLTVKTLAITGERAEAVLELVLTRGGKTVFSETQPITLFSRTLKVEPVAGLALGVLDPGGKLAPVLTAWGLQPDALTGMDQIPARTGVVIVGADVLKKGGAALLNRLKTFVAKGGRALVLEQDCAYPTEVLPFPLTTSPAEGAMAFPRGVHPALAGIGPEDLSVWGPAEAVFAKPFLRSPQWPLLVDASTKNGLDLAPVVESSWGKGHLVLSQMLITRNLGVDPMAERLLAGLVRYLLHLPSRQGALTSLLDPKSREGQCLTSGGFVFEPGAPEELEIALGNAATVVAAGSASLLAELKTAKDFPAFTARGGWLLLQGLQPEAVGDLGEVIGVPLILRPVGQERCVITARNEPLMAGLGNEEFYWDQKMNEEKAREACFLFGDMPLRSGVFSGALVGADVCGLTGETSLYNGLTSEDHWKYIMYNWAPDLTLNWHQFFPIAKVVVTVNRHYRHMEELSLTLGDDKAGALVQPVSHERGVPVVFELKPPRAARTLNLKPTKCSKDGLSGWDLVEIHRVLPEGFAQKVIPLTRPAGIVKFPMGKGGILLNLTSLADPKGDRVLLQLLHNLGVPRGRAGGPGAASSEAEPGRGGGGGEPDLGL